MSDTTCPLCGGRMDAEGRYPRRVCETGVGRARDENGRPLQFFNTGLSGGFMARFVDDGKEREGHECVIDGVRCWADEAYSGGIVVEVMAQGDPPARRPISTPSARPGTLPADAANRTTAAQRRADTAQAEAGTAAVGPTDDGFGPMRAAMEKAWWKDMTGLVGPTDRQLVVIKPRSDATPDELRALGQALALWKAEYKEARHIWGLVELLQGRPPRTPPVDLAVPVLIARLAECYEPVALVYVAEGGDLQAAAATLDDRLAEFHGRLAWIGSPDEYCDQQR